MAGPRRWWSEAKVVFTGLCLVLFRLFINYLSWTQWSWRSLPTLIIWTKGHVTMTASFPVVQNWEVWLICHRLENWPDRNLMKFIKGKYNVLTWEATIPCSSTYLELPRWKATPQKKRSWHPGGHQIKWTIKPYVKTGCVGKNVTSRSREGLPSFLLSTGGTTLEVLSPVLDFPIQERHGHNKVSLAKMIKGLESLL